MGSRIRSNAEHVFDVFCEIAIPKSSSEHPFILTKFPDSFGDNEVLKSIPQFSYPCQVITENVTHFSFVLTGGDSKWTFGFVRYTKSPAATCLVILSSLPWHDTFYKTLNFIANLTNKESPVHLAKFLEALHSMPVPDAGLQLSVAYYINAKEFTFCTPCPDHHKIPCIPDDRNLTEYYNAVDSHTMILIFASLLNERRILMTSKKLSRLSACIQAANSLIYPMYWQHIFIPVLPNHLLDYLSAPMPFLIGVPSETFNHVKRRELGDVVILDADENRLETPYDDVHLLPMEIITFLKKNLSPKPNNNLLGDTVARTFLKALVMLIGGYRDALCFPAGERITFNREAFINSRPPPMQPFLERMLQLQIFQQFIEGRLNMLHEGQGFNDEFEFELNLHEDKSTHKILKNQYNEWLSGIKKEGSAIIKSVNPAMKAAARHVRNAGRQIKDKSKTAYRDFRAILQQNSIHLPSTSGPSRPRSAPSSPVASPKDYSRKGHYKSPVFRVASGVNPGVKKSMSGLIVEKTDKTTTYVRERPPPSAAEVNGSLGKSTLPNSRSSDNLTSLMPSESRSKPIFEMGDLLGELEDIFSLNYGHYHQQQQSSSAQQVEQMSLFDRPQAVVNSSSSSLLLPPPPQPPPTGHHKSPTTTTSSNTTSSSSLEKPTKRVSKTQLSQDLIKLESPEDIYQVFDPLMPCNSNSSSSSLGPTNNSSVFHSNESSSSSSSFPFNPFPQQPAGPPLHHLTTSAPQLPSSGPDLLAPLFPPYQGFNRNSSFTSSTLSCNSSTTPNGGELFRSQQYFPDSNSTLASSSSSISSNSTITSLPRPVSSSRSFKLQPVQNLKLDSDFFDLPQGQSNNQTPFFNENANTLTNETNAKTNNNHLVTTSSPSSATCPYNFPNPKPLNSWQKFE